MRTGRLLIPLVICIYLLWSARSGLRAYFTGDDLMNLYGAWVEPASDLFWDNVFYFSPAYRPMGALFYRAVYAVAGFQPLVFRALAFALLLANVWILFEFLRALTGSLEIAGLAALLAAYHPRMAELYCSTGTIYDVLCFFFYYGALLLYVRTRSTGVPLGRKRLLLFLVAYAAALDSKEMAASLPLVLAAYELLYQDRARRRWTPALAAAAMTVPYVLQKTAAGPLHGSAAYAPELSFARFTGVWGEYLGQLLYRPGALGLPALAAVAAVSIALVLWLRNRHLAFAWGLAVCAMLPIAFIPARAAFALYVPLAGLVLYVAILIVGARDRLWQPHGRAGTVARVALFVCVLLLLVRAHRVQRSWTMPCRAGRQEIIRSVAGGLDRSRPPRRVAVLNDPFGGDYTMEFLFRLYYRNKAIVVDRFAAGAPAPARAGYDLVVDCTRIN